ncbi:hypothetical protein Efla_002612 [Eimeria flavescens]
MANPSPAPLKRLLSLVFFCFSLCAFSPAHAAKSDRCSDASRGAPGICQVRPLGMWQGRPTYDPYEALGVPANAPQEKILKAYRVKARMCHPDKLRPSCLSKEGFGREGEKQTQEEPFVIINAAYEMLRKPEERKLFDASGSGDGGRFARRGMINEGKKNMSLQDLFAFFAERFGFTADAGEEEEEEEVEEEVEEEEEEEDEEDASFPHAAFFDFEGQEEEAEEAEEEEEDGDVFHLGWDIADFTDLF